MRSIRGIEDIDRAKCTEELDSIIEQLRRKGIEDDKILDTLISALSFKYWHENCSCMVNSAVDSTDLDYVRLHWGLFCNSMIGKALCREAANVNVRHIADVLGRLSNYITHRHFDQDNVDLISHLAPLIKSQEDKSATKRIEVLGLVYGRVLARTDGLRAHSADITIENEACPNKTRKCQRCSRHY